MYGQIVVLNGLDMMLNIIKPRHVLAIATISAEPDGIYVVGHLAEQVVVLGWEEAASDTFSVRML